MNYGIIHNRRPDPQKRGGPASMQALLSDPRMREIAKQMGLQPSDFGDEAQALWSTLNDLSSKDPKRYEAFINDQLQDGPPPTSEASSASNQSSNDAATSTPPRFFTPEPGFVVKCAMYHSIKCQQRETKLFLNLCGHKLVAAPTNPNNGQEVPEDTRAVPNTSNLQIPLVVGKLRELADLNGAVCCAVDVVLHPWVLRRAEWDSAFKREVLKLAVHWVQQDAGVRLVTPTGKFIKARYKGGVVVGRDIITTKFRLDEVDASKQRMESPTDLLKQMSVEEAKEEEATRELKATLSTSKGGEQSKTQAGQVLLEAPLMTVQPPPAPVTATETQSSQKKVLIEELPSASSPPGSSHGLEEKEEPCLVSKSATQQKKSEVVKRGFLNATTTRLYPKGSSEGRAPSAYVNLLSRSKVVDLGEAERQRKAQQDERKETMAFLQPTETKQLAGEEIDHGDHLFEQLCLQAEPDLQPATARRDDVTRSRADDSGTGSQLFGDGFEELSKLLAP
ncbi:hypothetical protein BBJ28_00018126 [Nothophytophthora sp. Chile5]|nr:hypothetical protein BBJ28_00018126 [Nothophytophthora sp. Chile5]